MKKILIIVWILTGCTTSKYQDVDLTLIPPGMVSNQVEIDVRVGIVNHAAVPTDLEVSLYLDCENESGLFFRDKVTVSANGSHCVRTALPAGSPAGEHKVLLVAASSDKTYRMARPLEIIDSSIRSTHRIGGAWMGFYHWSEIEGKHWNSDIKSMTEEDWRSMVRAMHQIGMDIIVAQELFRNQEYVGRHQLTVENYSGLAFYPSRLYPGRMPIDAADPFEAILSEADKLGMYVFAGVGLFAWFDFTSESLKWHKNVAKELWDMYGHHDSFYGFYISEEIHGSLDLDDLEPTEEGRRLRKAQIVEFFREFKRHCADFAPSKPVMLATNSMGVPRGEDTYPALLENLDILCPFGFARMPEGDLTGIEAATKLQDLCDNSGSHLWLDLEAFLFNEDTSLYPRDIEGVIRDLKMFPNFEKVLCYQFPGIFSDPAARIRVGEASTEQLFQNYLDYLNSIP